MCSLRQYIKEFEAWLTGLGKHEVAALTARVRLREISQHCVLRLRREASVREWSCSYCRCENTAIHLNGRRTMPRTKCRCCGSMSDVRSSMRTTAAVDDLLPLKPSNLDQQIVDEWEKLLDDIDDHPNENQCDGSDGLIIDSCPMMQKLFLMMKYYHIYIGKEICDLNDLHHGHIDSMSGLIENLRSISLIELENMFEHISTVHRTPAMFEHFIEGIGHCSDGDYCDIEQRNRGRIPFKRSNIALDDAPLDAVEQHTLSFFAKWHSFLFHPAFEDNLTDFTSSDKARIAKTSNTILANLSRRFSRRYFDYRFGVWIDYTAHSPSFESMREEMVGNETYPMTLGQWQNTLMNALTHLDSDKIKVEKRYIAERADEQYGIEVGQQIGIENIVAILIYCNYTNLQARFSETFRKIQDDDTDEMIVERHCHNYYWFGRCVLSTFAVFWMF